MLDRAAAESRARAAAGLPRTVRERRRALVACAVLAIVLHAAFIGGVGRGVPGAATETNPAPMSVRTLPDEPEPEATADAPAPATLVVPAPAPPPKARTARRPREPAAPVSRPAVDVAEKASADSGIDASGPVEAAASDSSTVPPVDAPVAVATPESPVTVLSDVGEAPAAAASTAASAVAAASGVGARPPLLASGEQPPPVYRTQLPPSVTLHYQVRRGFLRGTGEIRWQASGDRYRLVLEARVAGLALLTQTSEGGIDANGMAPVRFLDQRARRSAQAANFRRDDGRISFSGTGVEWPLLPGSQDRLSWMIQLAGIAAAEPERLVEGGRITMVVVGARGDAGVWTLRYAGLETIETAWGTVHAVKLVREGRSAYDTSAEIWLDPERSYLPAHATLRNSDGASEYDLLLERVEPG